MCACGNALCFIEVERQWRKRGVTYYFVLLSVDFRPMVERPYSAVVEEAIERPCFAVAGVAGAAGAAVVVEVAVGGS
jgi:hypothetical protein